MKKCSFRNRICLLLTLVLMLTCVCAETTSASTVSNYVNIMQKISTATANSPIRYNFSLSRKSDIYFILRTNERTGVSISVKEPLHDTPVESIYLPSTNPSWQYISDSGIYENTATINLDAGDYILELSFENDVTYNLSMNQISKVAKLNKSKVSITKGFTFQLKVDGGTIKKCSSNDKSIATVTQKGKITAKKTGQTKINVKLTNGKTLTCKVTVKGNKYSSDKISISDTMYNEYDMKAYSASFDSKGNITVKFIIANNSYGKLENIQNLKVTIKDSKKNTIASYKKNSYAVNVKSYSDKSYTITIPKSALKKSKSKIDLRTSKITITGKTANASL